MAQCSILVVDDDPSIRLAVAELLDEEGYPVAVATNGAEALQIVDANPPQVVLLDMRMPILDGWGFVKALHQRNVTLPILVMTAAHDAQSWAAEVGAAAYVAKPFDLFELMEAVKQLCATVERSE